MSTNSDESAELCEELKTLLERERMFLQDRVDFLKSSIELLSRDSGAVRFEVKINSAWQNEGEKNVKVRSHKPLPDAIKRAQRKFKKINNRSDIQGTYHVSAVIGEEQAWDMNLYFAIPQKLFSYLL